MLWYNKSIMLDLVLQSVYFMLPAYVANMLPQIFARFKLLEFLNIPVDFDSKIGEQTVFGRHKTWRGIIVGVLGAILTIYLQKSLENKAFFLQISLLDYVSLNGVISGLLFGAGALLGDIVKSFVKRRINIAPGKSMPIFDQLDFVIGALIFMSLIYVPPFWNIVIILILSPILHLIVNIIAYFLKLKKVWY